MFIMHGTIRKVRLFSKRCNIQFLGVFWVFFRKKFQSWKKATIFSNFDLPQIFVKFEKLFFWKQTAYPKPFLAQNAIYWSSDSKRHPVMAFPQNINENYHSCGILLVILDNFWDYWPLTLIFWFEFDITSAMINIFSKFKNLNHQSSKHYPFKDILGY